MQDSVGTGIGYRRKHHAALVGDAETPRPRVLEIVPDHFFSCPEQLTELSERYPLFWHDVGLSLGTIEDGDGPMRDRIARIRGLLRHAPAQLFSEHAAITRSPAGVDLGHLAPLPYTRDMLDALCRRVALAQDLLGMPIALENIAMPFELPGDIPEPEFFAELTERTGCRILLDLTNLLYNARNAGRDPAEDVPTWPLHAVVQVHLAGGVHHDGFWHDTHSREVDDEAFELLRQLRGKAPLRAIIVERDQDLPSLTALVEEARHASSIWSEP